MSIGLVGAAYVAAAILFILSLGGLSNQESAKRAVWYGIAGMALAVLATVFGPDVDHLWVVILMVAGGAVLGTLVAQQRPDHAPQGLGGRHSGEEVLGEQVGEPFDPEQLPARCS